MSGIGILVELAWTRVTGRRVAGIIGWLWTMDMDMNAFDGQLAGGFLVPEEDGTYEVYA